MSTFIRKCREEAGLTQAQLAERMDVSVVAVQNWEKRKTNINLNRYTDLAAVFVARDIIRAIDTTGKWIDVLDLVENKNRDGRWDFEYFTVERVTMQSTPDLTADSTITASS